MTASERRAGPGVGETLVCLLLFSGLCWSLHEYHFVNNVSLSWDEAKDFCKDRFTALASIVNRKDQRRVKDAVGSDYQGKVWIGLMDKPDHWRWSIIGPNFDAPGESDFHRWHAGEPNNIQAGGRLGVAFREGTWYDLDSSTELPYVCYDKNLRNTSLGYVLVEQETSWWRAWMFCKENYTDLASVWNESENSEIQRLVGENRFVWIGLNRHPWSQWAGKNSRFDNWLSGHPKDLNASCAAGVFDAQHNGEWVEMKCDAKLPFVCHQTVIVPTVPPKTKQVLRFKVSALESTIDLNHPAVTEALLDQIEENIRAVGISSHFRVSWIKTSDQKIFSKEKKKKKKKK